MTTPNEQLIAQEAQCTKPALSRNPGQCVNGVQCLAGTRNETLKKIEAVVLVPVKPEPTFEERIKEFLAMLDKNAKFGAHVDFLDSVNSLEELEQIRKYVEENGINKEFSKPFDLTLFDFYRENLEKYREPEKEFPESFKRSFPRVIKRLNTPQKMRIFLRGAEFCRVSPFSLARCIEQILEEREVYDSDYLKAKCGYGPTVPDILAYYTQLQAHTLRSLMLPGLKSSGLHGSDVFFDFREEGESDDRGEGGNGKTL